MKLIMVLIALGVEFRLGSFDRYRDLSWFERYTAWLEARLGRHGPWYGPGGVLVTLFIPLALLGALVYLVAQVHFILGFLLSLLALVYSFGPSPGLLVDDYADALGGDDDAARREILGRILDDDGAAEEAGQDRALSSIMLRAHEYLFAVVFWFLLLGAVGGLLYCLAANLARRHEKVGDGYAGAARRLHNILMWPSARLLALGFALGGSLVSALESWRTVSGHTLDISREVIAVSGFGALHYDPASGEETDADNEVFIARLREVQALINRTLSVWLIVLGLMTIAGWIG